MIERNTLFLNFRRQLLIKVLFLAMLVVVSNSEKAFHRSCRRLSRKNGWWELVWNTYDDARFKKTFRVSRETFEFILSHIRHELERQTLCEEPIPLELRLGLALYRLGRGDYIYSIAEMTGLGPSTVSTIVIEVNQVILRCLWKSCVTVHIEDFEEKILNMEELWHFPFSWAAVDGCHIPIKCPPGSQASRKEYHNFKNFHSIVLMALVDAKHRFVASLETHTIL